MMSRKIVQENGRVHWLKYDDEDHKFIENLVINVNVYYNKVTAVSCYLNKEKKALSRLICNASKNEKISYIDSSVLNICKCNLFVYIPNRYYIDKSGEHHLVITKKNRSQYDTLYDKDDDKLIKKYLWSILEDKKKGRYSVAYSSNKKNIKMHRLVTRCPKGMVVDHINHNALDNRKDNLRICTTQQNSMNTSSRKNSTSKYKGVCLDKATNKWKAYATIRGKKRHLGYHDTQENAAIAHNHAIISGHGKFCNLNKIE